MNFSELQILGEKLQADPPSFAVSAPSISFGAKASL